MNWLTDLKALVKKKPIVVIQLNAEEWGHLNESKRGVNEFTIARSHDFFDRVSVPTVCLVIGKNDEGYKIYFGLASSRAPITTLESRLKIKRAMPIKPSEKSDLLALITETPHARNLRVRLESSDPVIPLSLVLSAHLVDKLATIDSNQGTMRVVTSLLSSPKYFNGNGAMQEDALHMALRAFAMSPDEQATSLELARGKDTALERINIMEDSVIEYDARTFPDFDLASSDITGRAVFEKS